MEPSQELAAKLNRRKIAVEGSTSSPHLGGGRCAASAPAAARIPPTRYIPQAGASGVGVRASMLASAVPRQAVLSARLGTSDYRQRNSHPWAGGNVDPRGLHAHGGPDLQLKVSALTLRNEQLTSEVEKMKHKLQDETGAYAEERNLLLQETDELLAETDRMTLRSRRVMQQRAELQAETNQAEVCRELHSEMHELRSEYSAVNSENSAFYSECSVLRRRNSELHSEEEAYRQKFLSGCRNSEQLTAEVEELRHQNSLLTVELTELRRSRSEEAGQMQKLKAEVDALRSQASSTSSCSEGRLRAALVSASSTSQQLRQAVSGVESLLDEARRELASKQLRERRAAFETLHEAIVKADEGLLAEAIQQARDAEVDEEDVEKAEAKLTELRSLTSEQRAARAARELEGKRKKEAFLLVKKDDAQSLEALLVELTEAGTRWQDWRDYAGRTMWSCAQELRATTVQRLLAPLIESKAAGDKAKGMGGPSDHSRLRFEPQSRVPAAHASQQAAAATGGAAPAPQDELARLAPRDEGPKRQPEATAGGTDRSAGHGVSGATEDYTNAARWGAPAGSPRPSSAGISGAASSSDMCADAALPVKLLTPEEEDKIKAKALRAVVQDDGETLGSILFTVQVDVWSRWENRAGKDLITLSQERGSATAYSVLAKALGLVKELKREAFEEREAVWVFQPGEVQPRRATVIEDTPEEADEILVEYWDGDQPEEHVERCLVRKMNS